MKRISLAKDFSRTPGGRYRSGGSFSAEEFREVHLVPAILDGDGPIEVDLDGTAGCAASFLEEAFGGLVRAFPGSHLEILERVNIVSEETPQYADEAQGFMRYVADFQESVQGKL